MRTLAASVILQELGLCAHGYAAVRPISLTVALLSIPIDRVTGAMHMRDTREGQQLERCAPIEGRKYALPEQHV